jgi:hypothetical protein
MFRRIFSKKSNILAINFARSQLKEPFCNVKNLNKNFVHTRSVTNNLKKTTPEINVQKLFKESVSEK